MFDYVIKVSVFGYSISPKYPGIIPRYRVLNHELKATVNQEFLRTLLIAQEVLVV